MEIGQLIYLDCDDVMKCDFNVCLKVMTSKFSHTDSESSATFSNSGSTPNGSSLGSETDEEGNDEELAK